MPLSATALMLTDIEPVVESSCDEAAVQEPLAADSGDTVELETLDTASPLVCYPVTTDEWASLQTQADEAVDVSAMEAVMEMGPEAWSGEGEAEDDFVEFTGLTEFGDLLPPPVLAPIETDPLLVNVPYIEWFNISYGISGFTHFEGHVIYKFPAELNIEFGGAINHTIKADSSGAFLLSLQLSSDVSGMVWVQASTPEGIKSNLEYDLII